ncbi:MAG: hypothetical protein AAF745_18730 [Planctomycetota bacterium]
MFGFATTCDGGKTNPNRLGLFQFGDGCQLADEAVGIADYTYLQTAIH